MQFSVKLPDGQKLIINKAFWTGKTEIRLDNGIIGTMGFQREKSFRIKYKDSTEHSLVIRHPIFDPMPIVLLDGNDVFAAKRFDKLQTAIICLPLLLIFPMFGAVAGAIAAGSVYINYYIARQPWQAPLRWTAIGSVPVVGLLIITAVHGIVWGKQQAAQSSPGNYIQTQAPAHHYDPTRDDNDPTIWAHPKGSSEEIARQERWVREGR